MLFTKTVAVSMRTEHTDTVCRKSKEFSNFKSMCTFTNLIIEKQAVVKQGNI
jgi:hypothetical protein